MGRHKLHDKLRNAPQETVAVLDNSRNRHKPIFAKILERHRAVSVSLWLAVGGLLLLLAILWSYWPTVLEMVRQWDRQPDYSHGYLVAPIALFFLWSRRAGFPEKKI